MKYVFDEVIEPLMMIVKNSQYTLYCSIMEEAGYRVIYALFPSSI